MIDTEKRKKIYPITTMIVASVTLSLIGYLIVVFVPRVWEAQLPKGNGARFIAMITTLIGLPLFFFAFRVYYLLVTALTSKIQSKLGHSIARTVIHTCAAILILSSLYHLAGLEIFLSVNIVVLGITLVLWFGYFMSMENVKDSIAEQSEELAARRNAAAQYDLGVWYATGRKMPFDRVKAFMWFARAAAQGYPHAAENRDTIVKDMTPDQMVEAKQRDHTS